MMGIKTFCLLFGAFVGLLCWAALRFFFPEDAWMAIPIGIGITIILHALIDILLCFEEKRYQKAEAAFPEPALFCWDVVNFTGEREKGARLYMFRDRIALLQLGNKPYRSFIKPLSELRSYHLDQTSPVLTIRFADDKWELFLADGSENIQDALQEAMRRP